MVVGTSIPLVPTVSAASSTGSVQIDPSFGGPEGIGSQPLSNGDLALFGVQTVQLGSGKTLVLKYGESAYAIERHNSDGSIDPTFGTAGRSPQVTSSGSNNGWFQPTLVADSDGRAYVTIVKNNGWTITRFGATGSIDTTFGSNGVASSPSLGYRLTGGQVRTFPLASGKIWVVTQSNGAGTAVTMQNILVMRLNQDGSLDTRFAFAGTSELNYAHTSGRGTGAFADALVDSSGRLVVLANWWDGNVQSSTLMRMLPNGQLDDGWGETYGYARSGSVTPAHAGFDQYQMSSIAPDGADGYYLIGSTNAMVATAYISMSHVDQDGVLDTTFGTNGIRVSSVDAAPAWGSALRVGTSVVFGAYGADNFQYMLRMDSDGSLNGSFGSAGRYDPPTSSVDAAHFSVISGVSAGPGGTVLVSTSHFFNGGSGWTNDGDTRVVAITAMGAPVSSWNTTFAAQSPPLVAHKWSGLTGVTPAPDGSVYVVESVSASATDGSVRVVKYSSSGTLDGSFGISGSVEFKLNGETTNVQSSAVQSDGKLLITATTGSSWPPTSAGVVRLGLNGALDTSFGGTGFVSLATDGPWAGTVLVDSTGRIVVIGQEGAQTYTPWIVRLLSNGALDPTFDGDSGSSNGKVLLDPSLGPWVLAPANGGSYMVGGGSSSGATLVRIGPDGSLDHSFGTGGVATFPVAISGTNPWAEFDSMVVLADGSVRAEFQQWTNTNHSATVLGVDPSGAKDAQFATAGEFRFPSSCAPDGHTAHVRGYMVDGSGLVIGSTSNVDNMPDGVDERGCLVRIAADGSLDTGFGVDGVILRSADGVNWRNLLPVRAGSTKWYLAEGTDSNADSGVWRVTRMMPTIVTTTTSTSTTTSTTTTVAPTTTTMPPASNVSVSGLPSLKKGSSTTAVAVGRKLGITGPAGSTTSVVVARSSSKVCKVVKTKLVAIAAGTCSVTVKVTPKGARGVSIKGVLLVS